MCLCGGRGGEREGKKNKIYIRIVLRGKNNNKKPRKAVVPRKIFDILKPLFKFFFFFFFTSLEFVRVIYIRNKLLYISEAN